MNFKRCDKCGVEDSSIERKTLVFNVVKDGCDIDHDIDLCADCQSKLYDELRVIVESKVNAKVEE